MADTFIQKRTRLGRGPARRVMTLVVVVLLLTTISSLGALFTARKMERLMRAMVSESLPGVEAATELQKALLQQRGLVAAYMLDDGRLAWVNDLDRIKPILDQRLTRARNTARTDEEKKVLGQLTEVYRAYDQDRERAIALFHSGRREEARQVLLGEASLLADQANELCRELVRLNENAMRISLREGQQRVELLGFALATGVALAVLLSIGLVLIIFRRLLNPVRRLADDAKAFSGSQDSHFIDEVHQLEHLWREIKTDTTRVRTDLAESQKRLLMSEKLAAVGKFAACAAHEIRSPLTSMKMWLYQVRLAGKGTPEIEHSCRVLDEEIGRLEALVNSFLQFSRPPSLQLSRRCLTELVDTTLELARHHLEHKGVRVVRTRGHLLPATMVDPHQLRQVLLNLITNAAEAAPPGGEVKISELHEPGGNGHPEVVVRIQDNGSGVPESIRARLFEPFVTSKAGGNGLGLAVAANILSQHGGRLELENSGPEGTIFAVRLAACQD